MDSNLDVQTFVAETAVNDVNMDDAFQKQSSLRAYYGALAAQCEAEAARLKVKSEVTEARLNKKYRDQAVAEGIKTSEKQLDNLVKLDPEWELDKQAWINAELKADIAKAFTASLSDRRDMLIQLGADRREDGKGQLRMMLAQKEADRLADIRDKARQVYQN